MVLGSCHETCSHSIGWCTLCSCRIVDYVGLPWPCTSTNLLVKVYFFTLCVASECPYRYSRPCLVLVKTHFYFNYRITERKVKCLQSFIFYSRTLFLWFFLCSIVIQNFTNFSIKVFISFKIYIDISYKFKGCRH